MNAPRELPPFAAEAADDRTGRGDFAKGIEHQLDTAANLAVRIELDGAVGAIDEADGQRQLQFTAPGFVANATLQSGTEHMQFGFAHGPLQAEQEPVVEMRRIVDAVLVQNQGAAERCEFEQPVPVGVVAGQPRDFQPEHDAGMPVRHFRHHLLEAVALGRTGAGNAEVAVDDVNALDRPAERHGALAQGVLTLGAFGIFEHLAQRRLPHVEISVTAQMVGGDLLRPISRHAGAPHGCAGPDWRAAERRHGRPEAA
jgi:hypothetical protein